MVDLSNFDRGQMVGVRLAGAPITKTATLLGILRATISKVMLAYTNHGRQHQQRGTVGKSQH
jgi:hypothetical protein